MLVTDFGDQRKKGYSDRGTSGSASFRSKGKDARNNVMLQ